ncbi:MAG: hypothetical protein LBC83_01810 [Oscillospiraceae bacterium]|jgi:phosphoribosyl 1,2-cyclic phosphate phosphodiesterase|nr:hypothetical protein [Oscillospiraceae bacterium]
MKIKYYGTAAAEGVPGMFCTCPTCQRAREAGGRNLRTRSQALVNDTLLIDFPPDTYWHVLQQGLPLPGITTLLVTHAHSDHLYPLDFEMRRAGFAHVEQNGRQHTEPLHIYASAATVRYIANADPINLTVDEAIDLHVVTPFTPFAVDGFNVTGLKADHDAKTEPLFYMIEKDGKALLYANDTGYFPEETWEYLASTKPRLDFVSLDCTGIVENYRQHHMGVQANYDTRERLQALRCTHESTQFCHHHFSHNGRLVYDEQVPLAEKNGFLVSYDGMEAVF